MILLAKRDCFGAPGCLNVVRTQGERFAMTMYGVYIGRNPCGFDNSAMKDSIRQVDCASGYNLGNVHSGTTGSPQTVSKSRPDATEVEFRQDPLRRTDGEKKDVRIAGILTYRDHLRLWRG